MMYKYLQCLLSNKSSMNHLNFYFNSNLIYFRMIYVRTEQKRYEYFRKICYLTFHNYLGLI